jgi:hypothetical protein
MRQASDSNKVIEKRAPHTATISAASSALRWSATSLSLSMSRIRSRDRRPDRAGLDRARVTATPGSGGIALDRVGDYLVERLERG